MESCNTTITFFVVVVLKLQKPSKEGPLLGTAMDKQISTGILRIHPPCSFAFLGQGVKVCGSRRNGPLFKCTAHCMISDCPVEVEVIVHSETTLKAHVYFTGDTKVHSKTELQRRLVRADNKKRIYQQLQSTLPRVLYLKNLEKRESVIESSCRDEVPPSGVLKSISWRQRVKERKHKNETLSY